ncbi:glycosyltransferase, partial [bacterium]|nr:glycosyltransferase [bacterium]
LGGAQAIHAVVDRVSDKLIVWKTTFDGDGWWRKVPLRRRQAKSSTILRELFRELWKAVFVEKLRPNGPDASQVVSWLQKSLSGFPENLQSTMFDGELEVAEDLIVLARRGKELATELYHLSDDLPANMDEILNVGKSIASIDRQIDDSTISHEIWRPLLMLTQFGRQNLPSGNLTQQAESTIRLFEQLEKRASWTIDLFRKTIELMEKNIKKKSDWITPPSHKSTRQKPQVKNGTSNGVIPGTNGFSRLRRKRFQGEKVTVIFLMSNYFIQSELAAAYEGLGHRVIRISFENNPEFIHQLLEASVNADLLITINHLGFDQFGELASLLHKIELPYVSWYVDRPGFILLNHEMGDREHAFIFTWERNTMAEISRYGFEHVHFLPLASDTNRFKPGKDEGNGRVRWVANSMVVPSRKWQGLAGIQEGMDSLFDRAVSLQKSGRIESLAALSTAARAQGINIDDWDKQRELTYASAIALTATRELRKELATACFSSDLHIYGDKYWEHLIQNLRYQGEVKYPDGLPGIYRFGIHLNATSFQMPSAVNQRVFDVPLCGGILITDDQEDLQELFDVDAECILYSSTEEAVERINYARNFPSQAHGTMEAAAKRILKEHTYIRRAEDILKVVKREYVGRKAVFQGG